MPEVRRLRVANLHQFKKRPSAKAATWSRPRRRNSGVLTVLTGLAGNPHRREVKSLSKTKKSRRSKGGKRIGGSGHRKGNPWHGGPKHRMGGKRRHRNPAMFGLRATDYLKLGAGAAVGAFASKAIPQLVLNTNNTGLYGYVAMAISTLGLTWAAQKWVSREMALGVAAGGTSALLLRLWQERVAGTSPAANPSLTGLGDPDMSAAGIGMYASDLVNSQGTGGPYVPASFKGVPAATAAAAGALTVPVQSRFKRYDA